MKLFQHRWQKWGVAILVAGLLLTLLGRGAGLRAAEQDKERLQLLWPDIMTMPIQDRTLIVRAAMECKVYRQPVQAEAVAQCLREGAERFRNDDALGAVRVNQLLAQIGR